MFRFRTKLDYLLSAYAMFILSFVFIVIIPIFKPSIYRTGGLTFGMGIGLGFAFLVVGIIELLIAKSKDKRRK